MMELIKVIGKMSVFYPCISQVRIEIYPPWNRSVIPSSIKVIEG
jgi:hypothetical protein